MSDNGTNPVSPSVTDALAGAPHTTLLAVAIGGLACALGIRVAAQRVIGWVYDPETWKFDARAPPERKTRRLLRRGVLTSTLGVLIASFLVFAFDMSGVNSTLSSNVVGMGWGNVLSYILDRAYATDEAQARLARDNDRLQSFRASLDELTTKEFAKYGVLVAIDMLFVQYIRSELSLEQIPWMKYTVFGTSLDKVLNFAVMNVVATFVYFAYSNSLRFDWAYIEGGSSFHDSVMCLILLVAMVAIVGRLDYAPSVRIAIGAGVFVFAILTVLLGPKHPNVGVWLYGLLVTVCFGTMALSTNAKSAWVTALLAWAGSTAPAMG